MKTILSVLFFLLSTPALAETGFSACRSSGGTIDECMKTQNVEAFRACRASGGTTAQCVRAKNSEGFKSCRASGGNIETCLAQSINACAPKANQHSKLAAHPVA